MPTNISAATRVNEAQFGKDSFILPHNDAAQARRAPDAKYGTETPSRRCLEPPGWADAVPTKEHSSTRSCAAQLCLEIAKEAKECRCVA